MSVASVNTNTANTNTASEAMPTAEQHGIKEHSDGRFGFVPVQTRSDRFKSVNVADFEAVTGRELVWKHSPVAKFTDLTGGTLDGSTYDISSTDVAGVSVDWVGRDDARIGLTGLPEERASANAWGAFEKALVITVTGEEPKEFTLTRANLGLAPRGAHTLIEAKPFSQAVVILENTGDARLSENVEIILGESANLTVITLQQWDDTAVQLSNHFATIGQHGIGHDAHQADIATAIYQGDAIGC